MDWKNFSRGRNFPNGIEWKYEKLEIIPLINLLDDFLLVLLLLEIINIL